MVHPVAKGTEERGTGRDRAPSSRRIPLSERPFHRRRPSAGLVVATIALSVAVGGTAVAATTINGANIKNKSIAGFKLKNEAVGTAQLADSGVQSRDLQNGSVTVSKLQNGSVTGPKLANGAVSGTKIAGSTVTRNNLAATARVPVVIVRQSAIGGVLANSVSEVQATCNAGETLLSGGVGPVSAPALGLSVIASRPQPVGGSPTSWQVIVGNSSSATQTFVAYAVCATTS